MSRAEKEAIVDAINKSGISLSSLEKGPTVVFINKKQFILSVKSDKLLVKEIGFIIGKKYYFNLSGFFCNPTK